MAKGVSAAKNTGGGGFGFEDDVCAWLLACMLAGESAFGSDLGPPVRLDFQTRPDGWLLDDALVTTSRHRIALSIKSSAQFTASAAPTEFVSSAWEQWLHVGSSIFRQGQDHLALVTAPLSSAAHSSLSGLVEKIRFADPQTIPTRLATRGWANRDERSLFSTFRCPSYLDTGLQLTDVDAARLVQSLRFVQHDFGLQISESLNRSLALCRTCIRSPSADAAEDLWNHLRKIAAELRPHAGSITLQQVVDRLRQRVRLADHPDHAADWEGLDARSRREAALVADTIAGRIRLPREEGVAALVDAYETHELIALIGPSGTGKSAVVRALLERRAASEERTLWLDARALDCPDFGVFESALRLQHPLAELLATEASARPVLILDGLDRLYSDNAFRNAATLVRLTRQDGAATRWHVISPCQAQEWPRVLEGLHRGGQAGDGWNEHQIGPLTVAQLKPVSQEIPALARLFLQPKVGPLMTNLKLLDLVCRRVDAGAAVDPSVWVGESSVADWFWNAEIDRGGDRVARGRFARELATRQADGLVASVPTDDFEVSELSPLQSLATDQLCVQVPGDRIAFAHDLYGDWARLRILLNHRGDLPTFFRGRRESPLWHRALRLLGIHLLEHSDGVDEWRSVLASFGQEGLPVLQDVLLEASVFAVNARALLDVVLTDLVANDGVFLRRLLTRFLAYATVPNLQMVEFAVSVGINPATARASYRNPHWPLWLDVLAFLFKHKEILVPAAPDEIGQIVEMWLEFTPKGATRRPEAAELAVLLGRHALSTRGTYGGGEWGRKRQRLYRCVLAAAHERTDDVAAICLTASERRGGASEAGPSVSSRRRRRGSLTGTGVIPPPWLDGPRAQVDEALQEVVLETAALMDLYRARPAEARELLLANLIQEPVEEDWGDHFMRRIKLSVVERREWLPALYTRGPFLLCLRENFREGLEIVARFVEFAAERERELARREANEWRARAVAEGQSEAEVDRALEEAVGRPIVLVDESGGHGFLGDQRTYGWSAGMGNTPYAIQSALMALEQYFYQRLEAGKDVAGEITEVLARCKSVAVLGVLCDVGKRERTLFEGPLRPLLSSPELYGWEITKRVHGRTSLMIRAFDQGQLFGKRAQEFHGLEHRKIDLRLVAISLMLERPKMREYFDRVLAAWSAGPAPPARIADLQQQLATSLQFENWKPQDHPVHGRVIVNVKAQEMDEARAEDLQALDDQMVVTTFPSRCRTILDGRQLLDEPQLSELWAQWQRLRGLATRGPELPNGEERFGDEYANGIAGGAAVFLWHAEWCGRESTRLPELVGALRAILKEPPDRGPFDSENTFTNWTFDCFAADAAVILWARDPTNVEWRREVAKAVFAHRYVVVKTLFARCAEVRLSLREDVTRLRRLALEWAYVRDRFDLLRRVPREALRLDEDAVERLERDVANWVDEKIAAFVSGAAPGLPTQWSECDEPHRFRDLDGLRRGGAGSPRVDLRVVHSAHEWLPLPSDARDEQERREVIAFWRSALDLAVQRPRADLRRHDHQFPGEEERWVLERAGATLLQLRPDEEPELLWHGIIDLHSEGHDWPEVFLRWLHRNALRAEPTPEAYVGLVRAMLLRALTEVEGRRRWLSHERVWDGLIGVDAYSRDLWAERHIVLVRELQDVFLVWMERVPADGSRIAGFASWLAKKAATPVRFSALAWLVRLVRVEEKDEPRDLEDADDPIAKLLNVVWAEQEQELRGDQGAFQAFRALLSWLGERQNRLGLDLLGRLGLA